MAYLRKGFGLSLVVLTIVALWSSLSKADVTGSFGVGFSVSPVPCQDLASYHGIVGFPDQPCEKTFFKTDIETNINVSVAISGLTMGLHSHAGVTGFEDILLSFQTTLGAVDIADLIIFAQPYGIIPIAGDYIPTCFEDAPKSGTCLTLFVKKRLETSIELGGVTFRNLAIFEDVNFPLPYSIKPPGAIYNQQSQSFGFGDLLTISGQTPSGISMTSQTGLCIENSSDWVKKHVYPFIVNRDCVPGSVPKPAALFDFERLSITGILLATDLSMDMFVECNVRLQLLCQFVNGFTLRNGLIFDVIRITTAFNGLPLGSSGASIGNIAVVSQKGPILISFVFDIGTFTVANLFFTANYTINPESNPASLQITASGNPGISSISVRLSVQRSMLNFFVVTNFDFNPSGHKFTFGSLNFGLSATAGAVSVSAIMALEDTGTIPEGSFLMGGVFSFGLSF